MGTLKVAGKRQVVAKLVKDTGLEKEQVAWLYDDLFNILRKCLEQGQDVNLPTIGRICLIPSREPFRSNMTGAIVPRHKRLKFRYNVRLAREIRVSTREPLTNK